jgi:hypothetical protein
MREAVPNWPGAFRPGTEMFSLALLLAFAICPGIQTFAAAPAVARVQPAAAIPGKENVLELIGENLGGPARLWTSFPCDGLLERDTETVAFKLKIAPDRTPGIGAIRLVTTNGMSALQLFLIDPAAAVTGGSTNRSIATAQPLAKGSAADGVCEELQSAFYRITARKGERLDLEVVAQRVGSPLDPLLRLLDAAGRELAANDDAPGLGADARLEFRVSKAGDYFVEVRDTRYAGSSRHRYRVRCAEPLPNPLPFFGNASLARFTGPLAAAPTVVEKEPNDLQAQSITLPVEINGRFGRPDDRDLFAFHARKGERLLFSGRARSLGSPCDLFLRIQTTNGTKIAESNATSSDEGVLTNRFTEGGVYHLVVEELNRLGGRDLNYRLAVQPLEPGFRLSAEAERFSVPSGEVIEIDVQAQRRDYDGPIALKLVGLGEGFAATHDVISAKTNGTKIRLTVPADLPLGEFFAFGLVGSAEIGNRQVTARVSTLPALRTLFPEMRDPPADLDGLMSLSISESKSTSPTPARRKRK